MNAAGPVRRYSLVQLLLGCAVGGLVGALALAALLEPRAIDRAPAPRRAMPVAPFATPLDFTAPPAVQHARERYEAMAAHVRSTLPPAEKQSMLDFFNGLRIPWAMWWLGVPVVKTPGDMWMMQQIIAEIRPDYVVEAGTYFGGSALYFAHVLDGLGLPQAKVITIDIEDMTRDVARYALWRERVEFIHGSSTDADVVGRISEMVRGRRVIVVLDSDHAKAHVAKELAAYAPLVSPGSYLVVEDTNLDATPGERPGPMAAANEFLASPAGAAFRRDFAREAFVYTLHPGGWLRRTEVAASGPSR